jgi:hypothetical protein
VSFNPTLTPPTYRQAGVMEREGMESFVVLSEPPIERHNPVCYKILLVNFGGSGDGQREFESRLRPPCKFS